MEANHHSFMPQYTQLREAVSKLPNPTSYSGSFIDIESKGNLISFKKVRIKKDNNFVSRWIYYGEILIRCEDIKNEYTKTRFS